MRLQALLILAVLPIFFISAYADPSSHDIATADNVLDVTGCLETEVGCYTPNILTLDVGHMVTMINFDFTGTLHTYTSGVGTPDGIFDSGSLIIGESFHWTTDTIGEFPYYCTFHPWMQGLIIVEPQEIFVEIDKSIYYMDEPILLTGEVEELLEGQALHLEMMDSREVIIFSDQLTVGENKQFNISLDTGVERMIIGNHFKIILVYGEKHAQVTFEYYNIPNPVELVPDETPVITLDELHSLVINNTSMMSGMYTDIYAMQEQSIQLDSLITSLTDTITLLQDEMIVLLELLEDKEIPLPQTLPIISNFAYSTTNGTVNLSWTVDSGEPIVKYVFKWRDEAGTAWEKDIVRVATLTSWELTGLENHEYEFSFFATNAVGNSELEYFVLTP